MATARRQCPTFSLYYTFNKNVKDVDLTVKQTKTLLRSLEELDDTKKEAVIMLMAEHARVVDGVEYDPESIELPYDLVQRKKDVHGDLENMPNELKWIIWKFVMVGNKV